MGLTNSPVVEFDLLISPDNKTYDFANHGNKFSMFVSGLGLPPIEYKTQRGPFQHGETLVDYFLRPRTITIGHRRNACSRQEYWDARLDLLNFIRPNRQIIVNGLAPYVFRKILPDGTKRDLNVFVQIGPLFRVGRQDQWDEWSIQEDLVFTAFDPLVTNPTKKIVTFVPTSTLVNLKFPISFGGSDIIFDHPIALDETFVVNYTGTWLSNPIIKIFGPISSPAVTNLATGDKLSLGYAVSAGETVTINTEYGNKTISNELGTNLIGTLSTDSDLATFRIEPDPTVPDGINTLQATGEDVNASLTSVVVEYFEKFIGI